MSTSGLDALFEKLKASREVKTAEQHWTEKKKEWLADVRQLLSTLSAWLQKGVDEGLIKLERRVITLEEEDLGTYEAPALDIHINAGGPRVIAVEPQGMRIAGVIGALDRRIVGVIGRVDLSCGPARSMLLRRKKGQWQFVAVDREFPSGESIMDLSEDSLATAIDDLID